MQKITPSFWFENRAEEAVNYYVSLFDNSKILGTEYYTEESAKASGMPVGSVMLINFQLEGQNFSALNGGPLFKFTSAVSFVIACENQAEIDKYWDAFSEGGQPSQCGWITDKFGLTWQVVPRILEELFSGSDESKKARAMSAMLKMGKLDIAELERAAS